MISSISTRMVNEIEPETVFLLSHVKKRLAQAKIEPFNFESMEFAKEKECK